jgi:predicted acetyltransferase
VLEDEIDARTWDELLDRNAAWWRTPGVLFPYLIRVDGIPAGFNLISSGPYVETPGVDFVQHEFFVAHAFRGSGVAAEAFRLGLARHAGAWEVATWPTAARALAFWRRTLRACAGADLVETEEELSWGPRVVFRFRDSR